MRALYNYRGERIEGGASRATRSRSSASTIRRPPASSRASSRTSARRAHLAGLRGQRLRREQLAQRSKADAVSLEDLFTGSRRASVQDLNLVLKGDVVGSVEAAVAELAKIQHPEVRVNVIHQGVGGITEGDIMLASASSALVVGFNVRPNAEARALAEREGVEIRTYRVIYELTEDIEQALVGMLSPVQTEETLGEAEVRALFRVSRLGTIAGCMVTNGVIRRNAQVRVVRDGTVIYETTIAQLKRFKDDVREVAEGFECGILLDGFNDLKEGDVLEAYETREVERTDSRRAAAPAGSAALDRVAPASSMGAGYVGILSVELHFPESRLAEGEAEVPALGEGAAPEPRRRVGRRGRPPRRLAARAPDARLRRARAPRGRAAARRGRALARRPGVGARPRRARGRRARGLTLDHCVEPTCAASTRRSGRSSPRRSATLKDPRIGFVTVTGVETTDRPAPGDRLRQRARLGAQARGDAGGLAAAPASSRRGSNRELHLKRTPLLAFEYDPSVERGVRMTQADR